MCVSRINIVLVAMILLLESILPPCIIHPLSYSTQGSLVMLLLVVVAVTIYLYRSASHNPVRHPCFANATSTSSTSGEKAGPTGKKKCSCVQWVPPDYQ